MTEKCGKALLVALVCSALMMVGYSQSNTPQGGRDRNPQTTTTPRTGADRNQTTANTAHPTPTTKVMEMNVAEVDLGKMAAGKAENARVKDFADLMVKDHTDALMKLRSVPGAPADVKPNAKQQQTMDRLSKLSGAQFDREYMRTMVSDHQEAVKALEHLSAHGGSTAPSGTDLASVARELLPTVQHHLQLAQEIQKELQTTPTTRANKGSTRSKPTPDSQTPDSQK